MQTTFRGYKIRIETDDDPLDPRDRDLMGIIGEWHSRMTFGDFKISKDGVYRSKFPDYTKEVAIREGRLWELEDIEQFMESQGWLWKPLYMISHSGTRLSLYDPECPFDSGQVGYVYITKENIRRQLGVKLVTKPVREEAWKWVEDELNDLDNYMNGGQYRFFIEDAPEWMVDSYGCYDSEKEALVEAKGCILDYLMNEKK